ncbi:hypothetical protein PF005_g24751 [Phytophthora fragariae]|uniref:Uncharacterized protein n=1 Tax=Phytophthora fragariae TaxID=53985 RepID=A0A6A3HR10_9STRA|nr:hypothetical protein PF003_g13989 [Phytophthora fragariae]KAE8924240.1 hypothetical protein PF009_g25521 [Phytophthora fragariae]KAE8972969.1 hypothetical protein PF011_g25438 [Phytophthora fragariae]KAE9078962.1 hypothetical protein PF010_g22936 [Phytophthora fragariae]KAE9088067.1 hypothetical protein PF007_g20120 [Phytophthora fragariae]
MVRPSIKSAKKRKQYKRVAVEYMYRHKKELLDYIDKDLTGTAPIQAMS